jgi:hypothetical protein
MRESYRLLLESLWFLDALADPEYSPFLLDDQRARLRDQLAHHLEALEADNQWSSKGDDASIFLIQKLPEGWDPRIFEPSAELRYTAKSPLLDNHRLLVLARDAPSLQRWTGFYNGALTLARKKLESVRRAS